jgi:bifunctional non-homologous end joining protein LigD
VGFLPDGTDDFRALVLAALEGDAFRFVGKVGTGFDGTMRERLNQALWTRLVGKPWVQCRMKAQWVEPGLVCRVRYLEMTSGGELRRPSFLELVQE